MYEAQYPICFVPADNLETARAWVFYGLPGDIEDHAHRDLSGAGHNMRTQGPCVQRGRNAQVSRPQQCVRVSVRPCALQTEDGSMPCGSLSRFETINMKMQSRLSPPPLFRPLLKWKSVKAVRHAKKRTHRHARVNTYTNTYTYTRQRPMT